MLASEDHGLLQLLECLYSAAVEPSGWSSFLHELGKKLNSQVATFSLLDSDHRRYAFECTLGLPQEAKLIYERHYGAIDEWYLRSKGQVFHGWVNDGRSLCPENSLRKTEFFNDFIDRFGWLHECAAVVELRGSTTSVITLLRDNHVEEFSDKDIALLRAVVPHLRRALNLHRQVVELRTDRALQHWALDQVSIGFILIPPAPLKPLMNRRAEQLCRMLGLTLRGRELRAQTPTADYSLRRLISSAGSLSTKDACDGVARITSQSGKSIVVFVAPILGERTVLPKDSIAVFLSDPSDMHHTAPNVLNVLYGLTPSESRLAETLADGRSIPEAASTLGIANSTAKSHLKSIFLKMNINRQAELVRLLAKLPTCSSMIR